MSDRRMASPNGVRRRSRALAPVDLLVTNSGGPPAGPSLSFDDQVWQSAFELLVLSAIRMVREVIPSMVDRKRGSVVMADFILRQGSPSRIWRSPTFCAFGWRLSRRLLANEYASHGIRVNHAGPRQNRNRPCAGNRRGEQQEEWNQR